MTTSEQEQCVLTRTEFRRLLVEAGIEKQECFFVPKFTSDGALDVESVPKEFTYNVAIPAAGDAFVLNNGVKIRPFSDTARCRKCARTLIEHCEDPERRPTKKRRLEDGEREASESLADQGRTLTQWQNQLLQSAESYRQPCLPATAVANNEVPLLNRDDEIANMLNALKNAIAKPSDDAPKAATAKPSDDSARHAVIGTVAIPGGGKTELLRQVCMSIAQEAFKPHPCRTVYLSYHAYPECLPPFPMNPHREPSEEEFKASRLKAEKYFALLVLRSCAVELEDALHAVTVSNPLAYGIQFLRGVMRAGTEPLVICVDELVQLDAQCPGNSNLTLHTLMSFQDENNAPTSGSPPVYFVFSALHKSMLETRVTPTGRSVTVTLIPLRPLTLEQTFACVGPALRAKAFEDARVYQLVLSCVGHPRSVADGLRAEAKYLSAPNVTCSALHNAQERIMSVIKLNFMSGEQMLDSIHRWFDFTTPLTAEEVRRYHEWGLLHDVDPGTDVMLFSPLLLLHWSSVHKGTRTAEDLRLALDADSQVEPGCEKPAEKVFYHFEAVRRLAAGEKPFNLEEYYKAKDAILGETFVRTTGKMHVKCALPARCSCIAKVKNFDNVSMIIDLLTGGSIVVSQSATQSGIEYLAPFHDPKTSKLVAIAGVQVKFVKKGPPTPWKEIHDGAVKALKPFALASKKGKPKYHTFPVIFTTTTVDQIGVAPETKEDLTAAVLYLELATFHWTRPLGILRLHVEKLGERLAKELPFLRVTTESSVESRSSVETESTRGVSIDETDTGPEDIIIE